MACRMQGRNRWLPGSSPPDVQVARPELEDLLQQLHGFAKSPAGGEGAEDSRPWKVSGSSGDVDARELVAGGDRQVRVGLVVLEQDVEPRSSVLDQPRLQQERVPLTLGLDDVDLADQFQHWLLAGPEIRGTR